LIDPVGDISWGNHIHVHVVKDVFIVVLLLHSVVDRDFVLSVPRHGLIPVLSIEDDSGSKPRVFTFVACKLDSLVKGPWSINVNNVLNGVGIVNVEAVIAYIFIVAVVSDHYIGPRILDSFIMLGNFVIEATSVVPDSVLEIPSG